MKLAGIVELLSTPLLVQKFLDPDVFPIMCYETLNVQNWMCELCTFSQIRSHIINYIGYHASNKIAIITKARGVSNEIKSLMKFEI